MEFCDIEPDDTQYVIDRDNATKYPYSYLLPILDTDTRYQIPGITHDTDIYTCYLNTNLLSDIDTYLIRIPDVTSTSIPLRAKREIKLFLLPPQASQLSQIML